MNYINLTITYNSKAEADYSTRFYFFCDREIFVKMKYTTLFDIKMRQKEMRTLRRFRISKTSNFYRVIRFNIYIISYKLCIKHETLRIFR